MIRIHGSTQPSISGEKPETKKKENDVAFNAEIMKEAQPSKKDKPSEMGEVTPRFCHAGCWIRYLKALCFTNRAKLDMIIM